jgi:hypothetical protein
LREVEREGQENARRMRAERRPLGGPIVLIAAALAATLSPA